MNDKCKMCCESICLSPNGIVALFVLLGYKLCYPCNWCVLEWEDSLRLELATEKRLLDWDWELWVT